RITGIPAPQQSSRKAFSIRSASDGGFTPSSKTSPPIRTPSTCASLDLGVLKKDDAGEFVLLRFCDRSSHVATEGTLGENLKNFILWEYHNVPDGPPQARDDPDSKAVKHY